MFFRSDCLDGLDALEGRSGRMVRDLLPNLGQRTSAARSLMLGACELLSRLSHEHREGADAHPQPKCDRATWRTILSIWEKAGFVRQVLSNGEPRFVLVTRMSETVLLKCPSCGAVGKGAKAKCLEEISCPRCHLRVGFVILFQEA